MACKHFVGSCLLRTHNAAIVKILIWEMGNNSYARYACLPIPLFTLVMNTWIDDDGAASTAAADDDDDTIFFANLRVFVSLQQKTLPFDLQDRSLSGEAKTFPHKQRQTDNK